MRNIKKLHEAKAILNQSTRERNRAIAMLPKKVAEKLTSPFLQLIAIQQAIETSINCEITREKLNVLAADRLKGKK